MTVPIAFGMYQGLGEAARDRIDAGLADAQDDVDRERVTPELEPLREGAGQRPGAEAELLGEQARRGPEAEGVVLRRDPQDQHGGHRQGYQVDGESHIG